MFCAATEKGSIPTVSPGLWWWHGKICEIYYIALICKIVVATLSSIAEALVRFPGGAKYILPYYHGIRV